VKLILTAWLGVAWFGKTRRGYIIGAKAPTVSNGKAGLGTAGLGGAWLHHRGESPDSFSGVARQG